MDERVHVFLAEPFPSRKVPLDSWKAENNPPQLVSLVDLSFKRLWVFTKEAIVALS